MLRSRRRLLVLLGVGIVIVTVYLKGFGGKELPPQVKDDFGDSRVHQLKGTVTYKGAPLTDGTIKLIGANGDIYMGSIARDGSYQIVGTTPGETKVAVAAVSIEIPAKYAKAETSGLSVVFERGVTIQNFVLD